MTKIKDVGTGKFQSYLNRPPKPNGKRNRISRTISASSKREAERLFKIMEGELLSGKRDIVEKEKLVLFSDLGTEYFADRTIMDGLASHTKKSYVSMWKCHTKGFFSGKTLQSINSKSVKDYLAYLKQKGLSDKTTLNHYTFLQSLFAYAELLEYQFKSPFNKSNKPRQSKNKEKAVIYNSEQLEQLLDRLDSLSGYELKYRVYYWIAICTGARRSEIAALSWDSILWDIPAIRFKETVQCSETKGMYVLNKLKSDTPARDITIPEILVNLLKEYQAYQSKEERKKSVGYNIDKRLFVAKGGGKPMSPDTFTQKFAELREQYNLPYIKLHGLRHTHCSILLAKGLTVKQVQYRMGHQTPEMTLQVYSHLTDKVDYGGADVMQGIIGNRGIDSRKRLEELAGMHPVINTQELVSMIQKKEKVDAWELIKFLESKENKTPCSVKCVKMGMA